MDALTAALALIVAQSCIALVMAGAWFVTRPERCTLYWASSAILIMAGMVLVILSRRVPALQLIGSSALVFGAVVQFRGLQAFYKVRRGFAGWAIGICACILFAVLGVAGASTYARILVLASALLALLALSCRVLLAGMQSRRTFASILTLGAIALLMSNNIVRIVAAIRQDSHLLAMTQSSLDISILYLVPLGGIFLYATGLLLLYFERVVDDKNHLAMHDELTGLLNRRAIVAGGEREVAVAIRTRQPLTVAFVDIDFFKRVNDDLGHEAGDSVLAHVAHLLRDATRNIDLVGRYGGDEFFLVFPCADDDGAATLGERLLATVQRYRFRGQHPITVSIGLASLPAGDQVGDPSWASLLHRADMALYQAKAMGRNRWCVAARPSREIMGTYPINSR